MFTTLATVRLFKRQFLQSKYCKKKKLFSGFSVFFCAYYNVYNAFIKLLKRRHMWKFWTVFFSSFLISILGRPWCSASHHFGLRDIRGITFDMAMECDNVSDIGLQYCVYLMLMMTTKLCGLLKATKALLPQEEGSYDDNGLTISTRPSNISEYGI